MALNTINQPTSHQIADVKLWAEIFCGFHIELRSPNPNVHSGFLKAEFSKVRKFQIIRLYFVLGRDIHIAQFHLTDYTHKISWFFFYSKNKEDNVNSPVIALYIHANGGMPVLNNLSTPIIIKLPLLNVSISLIR